MIGFGSAGHVNRRAGPPSHRDWSARRSAVLIAACVLVVSLAACDSGDPQPEVGPDWRRIDLPTTATSFAWADVKGAVVETEVDGARGAVQIDWLGVVEGIPFPPGEAPMLGLFPSDFGPIVLTGADDGSLLFYRFVNEIDLILDYELSPPVAQLEPLAVWWGTEDEGAILVAAYRQPDGRVGIYPEEWDSGTFEPEAKLFVDPDRLNEVRVAAREGQVVVVGPVGPEPTQLPTRDHTWAMQTIAEPVADGRLLPRPWRAVPLDPRPDVVTDVEGWEGDVVVAGRLDNRPLVWEVDVRRIDLPELELDADGAVLVADPFWLGDNPAIGLETTQGPILLLPGEGGWERITLPEGRLDDVVAIRDVRSYEETQESAREPGVGRIFAIIDGKVWLRTY